MKWYNNWQPSAASDHIYNGSRPLGRQDMRQPGSLLMPSPKFMRARCIGYSFEDPLFSAALMNESDILIGVHGR